MKRLSSKRQRGAVLVFFVFALFVMLLAAGLVVDLGVAYVGYSWLVRSVDAGALAGARNSSGTNAEIDAIVRKIASANLRGDLPVDFDVAITTPEADTKRIEVTGRTKTPALFSKLAGFDEFPLGANAEAIRYPLDMSLVLDVSYSLQRNNAFDDMQLASQGFVDYFDESVDQLGLVSYSTWAHEHEAPRKNFKARVKSAIGALAAISDTNIDEGLRFGKMQIDNTPQRANAIRIVVLFTDGRPTAFADAFDMPTGITPAVYDGVVAGFTSGSAYRGLFQTADGRKVVGFSRGVAITEPNGSSKASPLPKRLPDGSPANGNNIRKLGAIQAEAWADQIRRAGYTIYSVGLGNPNSNNPGDQPDLEFLRRIANENGIVDASQPDGLMVFAPTPADLDEVFARVADRILTRLTR